MGNSWNLDLLAAELRADLDAVEESTAVPPIPQPPPPNALPGFTITRVIASGGMGTVYEATQHSPGRRVALKIMKTGLASRDAMRRFQFEADTLARLNHPGIAHIYHCDTYDDGSGGVPYFAMELIEDAQNIANYCNDNDLSTRERLALFAEVCDAVHHGHQKSIIHRDLKPSNILVNAEVKPKIIDFGIARSTDADLTLTTMHTDSDQLIGTVAYMSPEQCSITAHKDVDVRSDVYALGVVLYELLCGRLPYEIEGKSHTQVARMIEEQPPIEPAIVKKELRGNINAILLKALEKDQYRRYQSAEEFAADIRRHLRKEPITARPPSKWQKAARWVGKHPVVVTATSCVVIVSLSLGLTFILISYLLRAPGRVQVSEDGRQVWVYSRGGAELKQWQSSVKDSLYATPLFAGSGKLSGHRLVAVSFTLETKERWSGRLCLFDADESLDDPRWSVRIKNSDIPPELSGSEEYDENHFGARQVQLCDVFSEYDGPEIIAVFYNYNLSPRVFRVYSQSGELLFQIWHDGSVGPIYWMKTHNIFVIGGDSKQYKWRRRRIDIDGYPDPIFFAIKPRLGYIGTQFLDSVPPFSSDSPVVWYKAFYPAEDVANLAPTLISEPIESNFRDDYALMKFQLKDRIDSSVGFSCRVSYDGHLVSGSILEHDAYRDLRDRGDAPDPRSVYLDDLPVARSGDD